jgi:drug/metabolite transporter (DMT)-like permease
MAATVKFLGDIPLAEKIFFRNLVGIFFGLFMVSRNGKKIKANNLKLVLLRNFIGFLAIASYFYAISQMKMADAVILNKTSPFFVMIFAVLFLNEKIKKTQLFSLLFAVLGALFVIKPSFGSEMIPALIALSAGILSGISYTLLRHLRKSESSETIVLSFCTFSTLATLPFLFTGKFVVPNLRQVLALFALGIFAAIAQFFVTHAYRFSEAGEVSIYAYTNIVFSVIIGIIIFSEIPDSFSIFGGAAIILAGFINFYASRLRKAGKFSKDSESKAASNRRARKAS